MKKLVVFDLDGTLAESKSSIDAEMATLLEKLLGFIKVAVISGGNWPQFQKQVLAHLAGNKSPTSYQRSSGHRTLRQLGQHELRRAIQSAARHKGQAQGH